MNIKQALEYGKNKLVENKIKEPLLKTRIVLANTINQEKEYLLTHEDNVLDKEAEQKYFSSIEKLCNNMPIQYITNKQEFMGLEFYVDENVLIPQPDTEILVEEVVNICRGRCPHRPETNKAISILDLCTGSGAIGISLAKYLENCEITLSDISKEALNIVEKNCNKIVGANCIYTSDNTNVGVDAHIDPKNTNNKIRLIQSDLFENIAGKFDIIVSNPPYIKTNVIKTLSKEVQCEPELALNGGVDGLEIYRRIINEANKYLNSEGYLCLEIGYDQKEEVINLLKDTKKYIDLYSKKDLSGNDRIVVCKNCQKSIE